MFPARPIMQTRYSSEDFEQTVIDDFTGGLNITDPAVSLPANQFTSMLNYYYNRQGILYSRPPFRPYCFSTSTLDKNIEVDLDWEGDTFKPSVIHDYQIFRETLSNGWSYNDEVHVVSGVFEDDDGSVADYYVVAAYNSTDAKWTVIWKALNSATTSVSVCPYKINQAFDLIIFPNNTNPQRWNPSATTSGGTNDDIVGDLTDLGLTAPTAASSFTATGTVSDSAEGMNRIAAGTLYYKFSFFYDDEGTTTKYGESATTLVTTGNCDTGITLTADATKKGKCSIAFTGVSVASNITKVRIYRAPDATSEGPFKYIGETDVTSTTAITTYVDTTPWGEEGVEDLQAGSNPSLSGSELSVLKATTIGAYIVGFDADIKNKFIYCTAGQPDVWNPLNYDYLEHDGEVVIAFNRKIYIYTNRECYQKDNVESAAYKISNVGCTDRRSLQDVGSGLIWMEYDSIYFANYVEQYGAKGDFPKDIGHRIAKSVKRRSTSHITNSAFFERRYYITYTDTEDYIPRTYVYDVDIGAWTQHSARHKVWARGEETLYSVGEGNSKYYVYEHDYSATVSEVTGRSDYDGKDYHDYDYVVAPIAHWKLDDNAANTTVSDEVGNNNGVASVNTNTTGFSVTGADGTALDMAGTRYVTVADDDIFSFTDSNGDNPFTVCLNVKSNASNTYRSLVTKADSYDAWPGEWSIYWHDGLIYFTLFDSTNSESQQVRTTTTYSNDTWYNVVCSYNGLQNNGLAIYIDGTLDNAWAAENDDYEGMVASAYNLTFGCDHSANAKFNGILDNIAIYDHQFSAEDAAAYNNDETTFFGGMKTITCTIARDHIKLAGDYRKVFVSSLSVEVDGSIVDILATIASENDSFFTNKTFDGGTDSEEIDTYAFIFDESVFADGAGTEAEDGDADEAGFAGFLGNDVVSMHKKIKRIIKSNTIGVTLTSADSRYMKLLYAVLYWKPLPPVA